MKNKYGKEFENLVYLINKTLHKSAIVTINDKLIDKHTKRKRQIDITIKMKDGPTELLVIIEARDRSRPVGIEYVEQVHSKINSVGANCGIIVSNKGFYETAIKKAKELGIKIFTIEEALKNDWSVTFKSFKFFIYSRIKCDKVTISFLDKKTNQVIIPNLKTIETVNSGNHNNLIFFNENYQPYKSFLDLFNLGFDLIQTEVSKDPEKEKLIELNHPQELNFYIPIDNSEIVYFIDENNNYKEIDFILFNGEFWREEKKYNPILLKYEDDNQNQFAEVLTFNEHEELKTQFILDKETNTTSLFLTYNKQK
jgi:hypothetical protein